MSDVLELFAVQNSEGKWFHRKGYGGYGETWCDEQHKARIYTKLSQARAQVTYFTKNFPEYPAPNVVRFSMIGTGIVPPKTNKKKTLLDVEREVFAACKCFKSAEEHMKHCHEEASDYLRVFPDHIVPKGGDCAIYRKYFFSRESETEVKLGFAYERPAGDWRVFVYLNDDGKLIADFKGWGPEGDERKIEMEATTVDVFRKSNGGYV
jgi:hypothetical protein